MTYKRETFDKLHKIFCGIYNQITRKNASKNTKIVKAREYLIIYAYNSIIKQVHYCREINSEDKEEIEDQFDIIKTNLVESLQILQSEHKLPNELNPIGVEQPENLKTKQIEIQKKIKYLDEIVNPENEVILLKTSESETETEDEVNDNQNKKDIIDKEKIKKLIMEPAQIIEHLNRIMKDTFDGEPTNLDNFIGKINLAKTIIKDQHPNVFVAFIKTRLSGKALEYVKNLNTIDEIIENLKSTIKPESSRVLENRLTSLRMNNKNKSEFTKEIETVSEMLRLSLISDKIPDDVAKRIILEKTVEACNNNARSDRIKSILSAKSFKTTAEVVSELFIQIDTCKVEHQINALRITNNNRNRGNNNRGNVRFTSNRGFCGRNYRNNNNNYNNSYNNRYNNRYNGRGYNNSRGRGNYYNNRGNYNNQNRRGNYNNNNNSNYNNSNSRDVRFLENRNSSDQTNANQASRSNIYQNQE